MLDTIFVNHLPLLTNESNLSTIINVEKLGLLFNQVEHRLNFKILINNKLIPEKYM